MKKRCFGEPNEKQKLFLLDHHRHVAYGGARGGGKSWAVRTKAKLLALHFAGIKVLIVRRAMPELRNNHIEPLKKELAGIAKYNTTDKTFRFPNGSTITFGYCDNAGDLGQYQGAEYDVLFIDEAGQLQKEWIDQINACVRGTNPFPKRTYYTLNPGGPAHAYFKRLFIDRRFEDKEKPENYSFIQALVQDNKVLMQIQPEYIEQLETLPPKLREAWLYGRWDVYEGQFFEDFRDDPEHYKDRRWTHVIEPFEIPDGWTICRSYDFGYGKPFSCAWWAVDYDGVIYRILELYGCTKTPNEGVKWNPDKQFAEISRIERTMRGSKGRTSSASPTRRAGRRIAERASCRPQRNTVYIFHRETTSALRGGCSATTGYSLTRMDTRACMYLQGAKRLSGRSRCSCMTSTRWRIWIRKWRITARTNGGICACRGQSSRRYRQKHRRFCLIPWT